MKLNRLPLWAALGASLIATAPVDAAYVGISLSLHAVTTPAQTGGVSRNVWRAYAHFTDPNDRLTAVFGNAQSPMTIEPFFGSFYNVPVGGALPLDSLALASAPAAQWDTYVTIGLEAGYVGDPGANVVLSPGFSGIGNAGIVNSTNTAWATPGPLPQGAPVDGRVLYMQLVTDVNDFPTGMMGINWRSASGQNFQALNQVFTPAPGVLPLLSAMCLGGMRRRRM